MDYNLFWEHNPNPTGLIYEQLCRWKAAKPFQTILTRRLQSIEQTIPAVWFGKQAIIGVHDLRQR